MTPAEAFTVHHTYLIRQAWRMTRSLDAAEDLAQTVWFKAIRSWDSYDGRASRRTWLTTIMHNEFAMDLRKKRVRGKAVAIEVARLSQPPTFADVAETQERFRLVMRRFREDERTLALAWATGEWCPNDDATSTRKVRLTRAFRRVRMGVA